MEKSNKASSAAKGNKTRGSSRKNEKANNKRGGRSRSVAAAYDPTPTKGTSGPARIQKQRWCMGTVYIGNGTLGVAGQAYFSPFGLPSQVYAVNGGMPMVPVSGSDAYVGEPFINDAVKHFARYRVTKMRMEILTNHTATTNDGTIVVAPVRGMGDPSGGALATGATPVGATVAQVESFDDRLVLAPYRNGYLDLKKYIAGGSGPNQDEFDVSAAGAQTLGSLLTVGLKPYWKGAFPCCIVVGGSVSTSTLNGSTTHNIWIERTIELLDWIGAGTIYNPIAYYTSEIERFQRLLDAHIAHMNGTEKSDVVPQRVAATCRQLFDLRRRLQASGVTPPVDSFCPDGCPSCAQRTAQLLLNAKTAKAAP